MSHSIVLLRVEKKNNKYYKFKISLINVEIGNKENTITLYYENKLNQYKKLNKFGKELVFKVFPLSCPDTYTAIDNKCVNKKEVLWAYFFELQLFLLSNSLQFINNCSSINTRCSL